MDKVEIANILNDLEQRLLKAEDLAYKDVNLVYEEKDKAQMDAVSSLTALIIKWLEGKMVVINILGDEDAKWKSGRNQLITELIGEVK